MPTESTFLGAISLDDLVSGASPSRRPQRPLPQPEATALTLAERLIELRVTHRMKEGDMVTYKNGWDPRRRAHKNQPMLLLDDRAESYNDEAFGSVIGRGDTIVAFLHSDGTAILSKTDQRFLEPWPRAGGDLPPEQEDDED